MPVIRTKFRRTLVLSLIAAASFGSAASAIDRDVFPGRRIGDALPGYGSSSSGYGAERQYYGAQNIVRQRPGTGFGTVDGYGGRIVRFLDGFDPQDEDGVVSAFGAFDAREGVFPGFETASGGSVLYLDDQSDMPSESVAHLRSNIVDVDKERLDRQPIGASGVAVAQIGTTKIIRIAGSAERGDAPRAEPEREGKQAGLAPWTEQWARYCSRAHRSFDPERGTYTGADGEVRFCTGD